MCCLGPSKLRRVLLLFVAASTLSLLNSAGARDYLVDPNDANAYATVQAAADAVFGQSEFDRANIFIAPGRYHELVTIAKPYVSFIGTGVSASATTIRFSPPLV